MKFKFTFLALLIFAINSYAQTITGKVLDGDKLPLELATCAVIDPADSTMIAYANTNKDGVFEIDNLLPGKVVFQIHYVGFSTFQKELNISDKKIYLGEVKLEQGLELENVTVVGVIPVKIKQDTIAYNTKAFRVRVDDNVEDLLKKLPGVEVDASGNVTAQGESVSKVYVDGKEFFSGDPKIATKNLSADAIKSVEIIDEKSEKSRLTGITDTERNKVLNLKLKDDKKVNDFGKFQGGYGTDNRYTSNFNYNRFTPKVQWTVLGRLNNINSSGSDITDVISFGGGGRGGMFMANTAGASGGSSGFTTNGMIGTNLGYEFKERSNLTADYNYNYTDYNSGKVITDRTEYVLDRQIKSFSESESNNLSKSNNLNFNYTDRSSDKTSLMIFGRTSISNSIGASRDTLSKDDGYGNPNLVSNGTTATESDAKSANFTTLYNIRFNEKSKRFLAGFLNLNLSSNNSYSVNDQKNYFNINQSNASDSTFKAVKNSKNSSLGGQLRIRYSEPLAENHNLEFEVSSNFSFSNEDVNQDNIVEGISKNPLIYDYSFNSIDATYGTNYQYTLGKYNFKAGVEYNQVNVNFALRNTNIDQSRVYSLISPTFSIFRRERGNFMMFNLSRSMAAPSATQLSPVVNNFNRLFISQGNPNLDPSTNYSSSFMWNKFDFEKGSTLSFRTSLTFTDNAIISEESTDLNTNVRTTTYVNKGSKTSGSINANFGRRINSLAIRFNTNAGFSYSEYLTLVNTLENQTKSQTYTYSLSIENNNKDKFDVSTGGNWSYNITSFTSGNNADRNYFQQSYYVKADWNITERLNLNSQFTYSIYTDSNFGTNISAPIWNAGLSYAMLASKRLSLGINAMDILNRNIGVSQTSSDNYFQEIQRDVLSNYYMLTLTYNLNDIGGSGQKAPRQPRGHFRVM